MASDNTMLGADLMSGLMRKLTSQIGALQSELSQIESTVASKSGLEKAVKALISDSQHLELALVPGIIMRLSKERSLGAVLTGEEGQVLAWALQKPQPRLRELLVHGAVLTVEDDDLPKPVWGALRGAAADLKLDLRVLRRTAVGLSEQAVAALGEGAAELLAEADSLARNHLVPRQLQTSQLLPLALLDRCHSLAQQAAAGRAIGAAEVQWVTTHRAAKLHRAEVAVLEALARLSRYLAEEDEAPGDVLGQVRAYQQQGAFADLAMLQLRRAQAGSAYYHAEVDAVLRAAQAPVQLVQTAASLLR